MNLSSEALNQLAKAESVMCIIQLHIVCKRGLPFSLTCKRSHLLSPGHAHLAHAWRTGTHECPTEHVLGRVLVFRQEMLKEGEELLGVGLGPDS